MPLGGTLGCTMQGDGKGGDGHAATSAAQCVHACDSADACASWQFADGICLLNADVPLTAFVPTSTCGLAGRGWSAADGAISFNMHASSGAIGSSTGDVTLRAVVEGYVAGASAAFAAADVPAAIFASFGSASGFAPGADGLLAGGTSFGATPAAHGAASASAVVAAGGVATLTIVFAWSFPNRNWNGEPMLGNGYSALFPDSDVAATQLANAASLVSVVRDINAHHEVVASPRNPAPAWLKDMPLIQFSHAHMLMWFGDGRMREYEAFSCDDVDSVPNYYQRYLLYLSSFPEFEASKLQAWSGFAQAADGHVMEELAGGCGGGRPGDLDGLSGRLMGDTTSLFVVEVVEWWHLSGDTIELERRWPSVARAVAWMIRNTGASALPRILETTYDHFGFGARETVAYNAFIFLTAMASAHEAATFLGDTPVADATAAALSCAQAATTALLFNASAGYYRVFSGGDAVFTDTLYGLMLGHGLGFGLLADADKVAAHLSAEWAHNQDSFGMRVIEAAPSHANKQQKHQCHASVALGEATSADSTTSRCSKERVQSFDCVTRAVSTALVTLPASRPA